MALKSQTAMIYGLQVTLQNRFLDFRIVSLGSIKTAVLKLGFYSIDSLASEVERAIREADPSNLYTVIVQRGFNAGREVRMTITSAGSFLSLLFGSGTYSTQSCASLLGYLSSDYTGGLTYTAHSTMGTTLVPEMLGYSYRDDRHNQKVFGAVNVSATGNKESVTFQIQKFIEVTFKYEPESRMESDWVPFWQWAIQQRPFDLIPEIGSPSRYYSVTLESTSEESKGLGFGMNEMLPQFPGLWQTGKLKFRIIEEAARFVSEG